MIAAVETRFSSKQNNFVWNDYISSFWYTFTSQPDLNERYDYFKFKDQAYWQLLHGYPGFSEYQNQTRKKDLSGRCFC